MKFRKILAGVLCFGFLLANVSLPVRAAEVAPEEAVASVTFADASERYFDTLSGTDGAFAAAQTEDGSTVTLLKDIALTESISLYSGDFTLDFNGKRITTPTNITPLVFFSGSFLLTDSTAEKKGGITGGSSAVSVTSLTASDDPVSLTIDAGHYTSNTWTIHLTGTNTATTINGGSFEGYIAVQVDGGICDITGGTFTGKRQASLCSNAVVNITGGTFIGTIDNFSSANLSLRGGKVVINETDFSADCGINNTGTLNLYDGEILSNAAEDGLSGIESDGVLGFYGDVTIQGFDADLLLKKPMTVFAAPENVYRVRVPLSSDGEDVIFANADGSTPLLKDRFRATEEGFIVVEKGSSSLAVKKCSHPAADASFHCTDCGIAFHAQVGERYFATLDAAFEAVKAAKAEDGVTVLLLSDIEEEAATKGGEFTLDLNGKTLKGVLSVLRSKLTVDGNGGALLNEEGTPLTVGADSAVTVTGTTSLKGRTAANNEGVLIFNGENVTANGKTIGVGNNGGTFSLVKGTVTGKEVGLFNVLGTAELADGGLTAEQMAVFNLGGEVTVGREGGEGPLLKAPVGVLHSGLDLNGETLDAVLTVLGGRFDAETDLSNAAGDLPFFGGEDSSLPAKPGKITLKGGTFLNGIRLEAEGSDLNDLLAKDYGYYSEADNKLAPNDGDLTLSETVTVKNVNDVVPGGSGSTPDTGDHTDRLGLSLVLFLSAAALLAAAKKRAKQ